MTVCIGITFPYTDKIVLVTDQLLSSDEVSVDGAMKFARVAPGIAWFVLFAGDPSRFPLLIDRVQEILGDVKNTRLELSTVTEAFETAYAHEIKRRIDLEILSPYGMDRDEFIQKGKDYLGEVRFNYVMDQISTIDLDIEVLVAGLDPFGQSKLFSVSERGVATLSVLPYHAIGAGAFVALGALYNLSLFPNMDLSETIYRACAAKFTAEMAPSVGESTYAIAISALSDSWQLITNVDELREIWRKKGQPPFPPNARRLIAQILQSNG